MSVDVVAKVGGIFALLVLIHFVSDWVFQSHAEAMAKPRDSWVRARHCLIYTILCCVPLTFLVKSIPVLAVAALVLWLSHFMEDTYLPVFIWARFIRKPGPMNNLKDFVLFAESTLGKILLIAIDQIVHLVFMVPVAVMIVSPASLFVCSAVCLTALVALAVVCLLGASYLKPPWRLWLDDQLDTIPSRFTPEGYVGAKSSLAARELVLKKGLPEIMDLDHDLGGEDTVMIFLKWLAGKYPNGPVPEYHIHSENVAGQKTIQSYMDSWKRSLDL